MSCACVLPARSVHAASSKDVGTVSVQVLKLGAGARAAGMGNAFTAVADDVSAVYWNPAGLAVTEQESAALMHAILPEGISYDWLGYVKPAGPGTFGAGLQRLSYGSIAETDETGFETGSFSPGETVGTVSYGLASGNVGFGASLKYISGKIKQSAATAAADLGLMYGISEDDSLSLGFVLQNLGGKMKYASEGDSLPLTFKVGAAYILTGSCLLAADAEMPSDNSLNFALGTEYDVEMREGLVVSLRAGYNTRARDLGGLAGVSAGAGARNQSGSVDYAFSPFGDLGSVHKISLSINF